MEESELPIKSIEVQLLRIETCGCAEGFSRDCVYIYFNIIFYASNLFLATEIQNIQIGDGDIARNVAVPIWMLFPRTFTCPTLLTTNFKIGMFGEIC